MFSPQSVACYRASFHFWIALPVDGHVVLEEGRVEAGLGPLERHVAEDVHEAARGKK